MLQVLASVQLVKGAISFRRPTFGAKEHVLACYLFHTAQCTWSVLTALEATHGAEMTAIGAKWGSAHLALVAQAGFVDLGLDCRVFGHAVFPTNIEYLVPV